MRVHVCVDCVCNCCVCVYVTYRYREHKGRYGTQQHREVATAAHHTEDSHDDREDEVMITNWMTALCIRCHLWSSWLLLDHHYMGIRLQERRGEEIERRLRGEKRRVRYTMTVLMQLPS